MGSILSIAPESEARVRAVGQIAAMLTRVEALSVEAGVGAVRSIDLETDGSSLMCTMMNDGIPAAGVPEFGSLTSSYYLPLRQTTGLLTKMVFWDMGLPFTPGGFSNPNVPGFITESASAQGQHSFYVYAVIRNQDPAATGSAPNTEVHVWGGIRDAEWYQRVSELESQLASGKRLALIQSSSVPSRTMAQHPELHMGPDLVDLLSFRYGILPVFANGNTTTVGQADPARSHVIANGFNVLSVGGTLPGTTPRNMTDDEIWSGSSYLNPPTLFGDHEKPDVVAAAVMGVPNTTGTGYDSQSGTSFAAPIVSGLVSRLIEANPVLQYRPELIKALLVASAIRMGGHVGLLRTEAGGWGHVGGRALAQLVNHDNAGYGARTFHCSGIPQTQTLVTIVPQVSGRRLRVAVSWSNDGERRTALPRPRADLDLRLIKRAVGVPPVAVKQSSLHDAVVEALDAPVDPFVSYDVVLVTQRCIAPGVVPLGYAWRTY